MIASNKLVFVIGEPGSGKSTQIPQYLLETEEYQNSNKKILMSLPRKVAAVNLSYRISEELKDEKGDVVVKY